MQGGESGRWIFQLGHLTWRALAPPLAKPSSLLTKAHNNWNLDLLSSLTISFVNFVQRKNKISTRVYLTDFARKFQNIAESDNIKCFSADRKKTFCTKSRFRLGHIIILWYTDMPKSLMYSVINIKIKM